MTNKLKKPHNETERLKALKRYEILDTPPDGSFDNLTSLASTLFNMPIAIISLVDENRIWFKSHHGVDADQIDRDPGLCASAILQDDLYIVENAATDPKTLANPLVAGELGLKFYAAAPLRTHDGYNLGTFCLIDQQQRYLTEPQKEILQRLANIVVDEIELRLSSRNLLQNTRDHLENTIKEIKALPDEHNEKLQNLMKTTKKLVTDIDKRLGYKS